MLTVVCSEKIIKSFSERYILRLLTIYVYAHCVKRTTNRNGHDTVFTF